jgi:rhodanese-related sulfurtransferase
MDSTGREVDVHELKRLRDSGTPHQLIDIREAYEVEVCSIGGEHIPMGELLDRLAELRRDVPVIVHCRSGRRGAAVCEALTVRYGFTNVRNLTGGILAWADAFEPDMPRD